MASSSCFPDVHTWLENLPPIPQWKTSSMSMNLCPSSSLPSLKLSVKNYNSSFSLSIYADYNLPLSLWKSKPFSANPTSNKILDDPQTALSLFLNIVEDVLKYCPSKTISPNLLRLPRSAYSESNLKDLFNFSFLSLAFIICIYEAPSDLRSSSLVTLKDQFACPKSRDASKILMRILGSNVEEQWMRSINLAITNWVLELQDGNIDCSSSTNGCRTPSPLFSYSISTYGLWKVQLYCPVVSMTVEKSSSPSPDENLVFSLNYHQLEGVIQLNHKVISQEKWVEVKVNIDNIRCDVVKLVTDTLMKERGAGKSEKHFPSRISLQITPTMQSNIISISVSKSSENPTRAIGIEKSIEVSFEPPNPHMGFSSGETMTITLKPWKFEQSVYGNTAILNWFLHDSVDGREVFSSKPSKFALLHPKAWFKNRYSHANRPFTRQGGVVFAGDEYGESVCWKVDKACMGRSMEWDIKGFIWLTYWPNEHRTLYTETRRLEFRETVSLTLV